MAFFISAERREAAAFLDTTIAETEAMLTQHSQGRGDELTLEFLRRLTPVFLDKSGVAPLPKQARKDDSIVPITVATPGQTIRLDDAYNHMSSLQARQLARTSQGWKARSDVVRDAANERRKGSRQPYEVRDRLAGFVLTQIAAVTVDSDNMGKTPARIVRGRPLVGLVGGDIPGAYPALTLHHELIHSIQFVDDPVVSLDPAKAKKTLQSQELEAYVTTGMLARRAYYNSQDPALRRNKALIDANWAVTDVWADNVQYKQSSEMLWEPQGKVLKALEEAQLAITQ